MRRLLVAVLAALVAVAVAGAEPMPGPPDGGARQGPAASDWVTMVHGYVFLNANRQGGDSGEQDFESENHLMVSATRTRGAATWALLGTFTVEPMTIPPAGASELFQRGETYRGALLVDRQHPHDLFAQLAAEWSRALGKGARLRLYVAPVGEPAVGPTPYVHRPSAAMNPVAPLSHHNQDSTHISSDVASAGVDLGRFGVEASLFHGREPDENRYDIDQGRPDSYAGRVTFRPVAGLVVQVSAARREHPEALEPENQTRQTASVEYARTTARGSFAAALIAGRNLLVDGQQERGNTLEASWTFARAHTVYGRTERADRDLFELLNKAERPSTVPPRRTAVDALTVGYARDLPLLSEARTSLGSALTVYRFDDRLDIVYGDRPVSAQIFLRFGFPAHGPEHHHGP